MASAAGGPSGPSPPQPVADHLNTVEPDQASQPLATHVEGVVPQPLAPHQNRRAVNSFMVFRAYMSAFLPAWTQARKSQFLGLLWRQNPQKAFFTVIAAAYTILRNDYVLLILSLPWFVANVFTYLFHLPNPDTYLEMSGWDLRFSEGSTSRFSWFGDLYSQLNVPVLLSVDDIVRWSLGFGLATPRPNLAENAARNNHGSSSNARATSTADTPIGNQGGSIDANSNTDELSELTLREVFGLNIEGLDPRRDLDYNYGMDVDSEDD